MSTGTRADASDRTGADASSVPQTLAGRVALVTGGGQGVGRGIALALAAAGAPVAIAGRTLEKCESVAGEIQERGGTAVPLRCDVKDRDQIEATVAATVERLGALDILVNNAQQTIRGRLLDVKDENYRAEWESGPLATHRFMQVAHPHLTNGGVIINLASHAGVKPNPSGAGTYAGVKEEIRTLTRAAAWEWAPDGIRAVCILPLSNSPAMERLKVDEPETVARVLSVVPMARLGDPEADIGRVVVFLAGPDAAYLTGISIPIDGGAAHIG